MARTETSAWRGVRCGAAAFVVSLALFGAPGVRADAPQTDWAERAVDDLHFIRATLRENHPGPKDEQNPWFREWYERGFSESLSLARRVQDRAGYYYAIQHYMVGFQDGHLIALVGFDPGDLSVLNVMGELNAELEQQWPGFVVGYRDGAFVVVEASPDRDVAVGDALVSCDGRAAGALGESILQRFVGLWSVEGYRPRIAPYLLVDQGNPFAERPEACVFERSGKKLRTKLRWEGIGFDPLKEKMSVAQQEAGAPIGVRNFGDGGKWVTLSSFLGQSEETVRALDGVIAAMNADIKSFREAPILVFDVRGNTGGSSTYGRTIAKAIWGGAYIDAIAPRSMGVDWRVSRGNAAQIKSTYERYRDREGEDHQYTRYFKGLAEALEAAVAAGATYHFEGSGTAPEAPGEARPESVSAKVFFLTDGYCASACLDFADLMTRIEGVTHIGRETSADAIYIDNRIQTMPSGEGMVAYSMKVYRGRPRGHNESYKPEHAWTGRMDDAAGLEAWIVSLAAGR